jgi:hypothetical protein
VGKTLKKTKMGFVNIDRNGAKWGPSLNDIARNGMLPTPRAGESIERRNWKTIKDKVENGGDVTLTTLAKYNHKMGLLPTPTCSDKNGSGSKEALEKRGRGERNDLGSWATMNTVGTTSQLNPRFVAEMMGFPPNWTELPFQNGETNQ